MLKIIYNLLPQKNISSDFHIKNNISDISDKLLLSKLIFNELNKFLINKEIEFDNVATDEKKHDKHITYNNFVINNLLNIMMYKDQLLKFSTLNNVKDNIQKKKLDNHDIKKKLDHISSLKNTIDDNLDIIDRKKIQISKKKISFAKMNYDQSKFFQTNGLLENVNILKNLYEGQIQYAFNKMGNHIVKNNNNSETNIKNEKNLIISQNFKNFKNYKNNLLFYDNPNKVKHLTNEINSSRNIDTKERIKSNTKPFLFYDSQNSIQWKKLISQKILLSIANKNNQVEIYLKPENLGSIYIKIKMNNDKAALDFISNHEEIRTFLDNHIFYLRHSLKKNGIKLGKVNIHSTLQSRKLKNYKNIFNLDEFQKKFDSHKKNINIENNSIDMFI